MPAGSGGRGRGDRRVLEVVGRKLAQFCWDPEEEGKGVAVYPAASGGKNQECLMYIGVIICTFSIPRSRHHEKKLGAAAPSNRGRG